MRNVMASDLGSFWPPCCEWMERPRRKPGGSASLTKHNASQASRWEMAVASRTRVVRRRRGEWM